MLALQLCGTVVTYLPTVPPPLYLQLAETSFRCPAKLVQADQTVPFSIFVKSRQLVSGTWRLVSADQLNQARAGDGALLPAEPSSLLWQPALAGQYRALMARGVTLVVEVPDLHAMPALATTYVGLGLEPGAALLNKAPPQEAQFGRGTYLLADIQGLTPLPEVAQLGGTQIIPYLIDGTGGRWAGPAPRSTFKPQTGLTWTYAGQTFNSSKPVTGQARLVATIMPIVWAVGRAVTVPLPSLIYTASSTVAWLVLALLLLTLLAILRTLLSRRAGTNRKPTQGGAS